MAEIRANRFPHSPGSYFSFTAARGRSPRPPWPAFTVVFAAFRRSAESERPHIIHLLELPAGVPFRKHNHAEEGFRREVQAQIDAIVRDLTAALANAHPKVELEIFAMPQFKWCATHTGVEEMSAAMTHTIGSLDHQTPTIENVLTQADTVVLFGHERGIIRATGAPYDVQYLAASNPQ